MLGQASVAITLDFYSHVTPTMQTKAARVVDDLLRLQSRHGNWAEQH
jgi:hypothetical protein